MITLKKTRFAQFYVRWDVPSTTGLKFYFRQKPRALHPVANATIKALTCFASKYSMFGCLSSWIFMGA